MGLKFHISFRWKGSGHRPGKATLGPGRSQCFATQSSISLGDKRHRWHQEAPGDGGYFVLTADTYGGTLLLPKYQIVINSNVLATRTSLGTVSHGLVTSILAKRGPATPHETACALAKHHSGHCHLPGGQKIKKYGEGGRPKSDGNSKSSPPAFQRLLCHKGQKQNTSIRAQNCSYDRLWISEAVTE